MNGSLSRVVLTRPCWGSSRRIQPNVIGSVGRKNPIQHRNSISLRQGISLRAMSHANTRPIARLIAVRTAPRAMVFHSELTVVEFEKASVQFLSPYTAAWAGPASLKV